MIVDVEAKYTSVWDNEIYITVACKFDIEQKLAFDLDSVDVQGIDILTDEYVTLKDGTVIPKGEFTWE